MHNKVRISVKFIAFAYGKSKNIISENNINHNDPPDTHLPKLSTSQFQTRTNVTLHRLALSIASLQSN